MFRRHWRGGNGYYRYETCRGNKNKNYKTVTEVRVGKEHWRRRYRRYRRNRRYRCYRRRGRSSKRFHRCLEKSSSWNGRKNTHTLDRDLVHSTEPGRVSTDAAVVKVRRKYANEPSPELKEQPLPIKAVLVCEVFTKRTRQANNVCNRLAISIFCNINGTLRKATELQSKHTS